MYLLHQLDKKNGPFKSTFPEDYLCNSKINDIRTKIKNLKKLKKMHYSPHLFHIELAVSPPAHTHGVHVERR